MKRMNFDIKKRAGQEQKWKDVEKISKDKKPKKEVNGMIERFQKDIIKRELARKVAAIYNKSRQVNTHAKKISITECDQFYKKQMETQKKNKEATTRKKQIIKHRKIHEELKEMKQDDGKRLGKEKLNQMLERFKWSEEAKNQKIKLIKEKQIENESKSLKTCFQPSRNSILTLSSFKPNNLLRSENNMDSNDSMKMLIMNYNSLCINDLPIEEKPNLIRATTLKKEAREKFDVEKNDNDKNNIEKNKAETFEN